MIRPSVILSICVRAETHTLLVVSLYLLFAGHNHPGGGFAGGLVAAGAVALRFVANTPEPPDQRSGPGSFQVMGGGLALALVAAIAPLFFGNSVFESSMATVESPVLGTAKISSVLAFDAGVYLVVVGAAMVLFEQLGRTRAGDASHTATEVTS